MISPQGRPSEELIPGRDRVGLAILGCTRSLAPAPGDTLILDRRLEEEIPRGRGVPGPSF